MFCYFFLMRERKRGKHNIVIIHEMHANKFHLANLNATKESENCHFPNGKLSVHMNKDSLC